MQPIILIVWAAFAATVMSPVGYWLARAVRRVRARRRLRALHEPVALPEAAGAGELGGHLRAAVELRSRLEKPLLETEDYIAALPVLDVALHLSRQLRRRSSWGMKMRARYETAVNEGFEDAERWCDAVDGSSDLVRDVLLRLGAGTRGIRTLVNSQRQDVAGWARDFGDRHDAEVTGKRIEALIEELSAFCRTVLDGQHDPYR